MAYANTDLRHGVCVVFPSLENTIVIPLLQNTRRSLKEQVHYQETFYRIYYISKGGALCQFWRRQSTQGESFPLFLFAV
jgi:hypothetical protein